MKTRIIASQFLLIINLVYSLNLFAKTTAHKSIGATKEKGEIVEITNQTELNANLPAVLEFYSENCGACIMFKKQYERIAKKYPSINFLKVDGVKNHNLVKAYKITAFPSFVFITKQNISNPKVIVGPKKHEIDMAIKELIDQTNASAIQTISSLAELEKLIKSSDKPVVASYQANWCGACKMFAPKFLEIANQYNDTVIFVKLNDETLQGKEFAKKHRLTSLPTTLIFKDQKSDTPVATIVGGDKDKLIKEIKQAIPTKTLATPTTIEILEIKNKAQFDELIQKTNVPVIIDYHAESWCPACKVYKDVFAAFAQQFPKLKFAKVDGHLAENRIIGDTYDIQKLPTTLIFEGGKKTRAIEGISPELQTILSALNNKS